MKFRFFLLIPLCLALFICLLAVAGCDMNGGSEDPVDETPQETKEPDDDPAVIPPPENLLGTIALNNGKPAVMELQFNSSASGAGARAAGTVGVSGKIRYDGNDFKAGGLYNEETGKLDILTEDNTTGLKFIFSGTYSATNGFSGKVTLYVTATDAVVTQGTVSATGTTDSEKSSVVIMTGTYGGDACGTWNGTLTNDRFFGTWAHYDGDGSGTISITRNGNTLTAAQGANPQCYGKVNGTTITGSWVFSGSEKGYWTGTKVNENYDPAVPNSGFDQNFLANLILQTFENGIGIIFSAIEEGLPSGTSYNNMTYTGDLSSTITVSFTDYIDSQTGLTINGDIRMTFISDDDYTLEADGTGQTGDGSDGGGLEITYEDNTTSDMFVFIETDFSAGDFTGSSIWELDGVSLIDQVDDYFF